MFHIRERILRVFFQSSRLDRKKTENTNRPELKFSYIEKKIVEFFARDTCYFRTIRNRRWSLRWRFELSLILLPPPLSPMVRQGRGITSATTVTAVSCRPFAIAINRGQLSTSSMDNNLLNIFVAAHVICSSIKRLTVYLHYNMLVTFLRFACCVFRIKNIFGIDRCWCMGCKLYFGCCRNKNHECIQKNAVYGMGRGGYKRFQHDGLGEFQHYA